MSVLKKRKWVMLPTNKPSNLLLTGRNDLYYITRDYGFKEDIDRFQQLYILSDEEIKEGDWFVIFNLKGEAKTIRQCKEVSGKYVVTT